MLLLSRLTAMVPVLTKALRILWAEAERPCTNGSIQLAHSSNCSARTRARQGLTTTLLPAGSTISVHGSSAATCLGRCVDLGLMSHGGAGGAKTRHIMCQSSCLRTT